MLVLLRYVPIHPCVLVMLLASRLMRGGGVGDDRNRLEKTVVRQRLYIHQHTSSSMTMMDSREGPAAVAASIPLRCFASAATFRRIRYDSSVACWVCVLSYRIIRYNSVYLTAALEERSTRLISGEYYFVLPEVYARWCAGASEERS